MRAKLATLLFTSAVCTVAASAALGQPLTQPTSSTDGQTAAATAPTYFDQVEEDWELVVLTPDPVAVGPQVTTCMGPSAGPATTFVAFDLNYHEFPSFFPGGMQLQVWSGGQLAGTASQGIAVLNTPGERITWTQQMILGGGNIIYDINNGKSVTWGDFGQGLWLSVSYPSPVISLAGYDPDVSAARSGVSWESNHVKSLTLVRVRYYALGQLVWTDTNPRVVFTSDAAQTDEGGQP